MNYAKLYSHYITGFSLTKLQKDHLIAMCPAVSCV